MGAALKGQPLADPTPPNGIVTVAVNRSTGALVPEGTPGALVEYIKTEDYDRIVAAGYGQQDYEEGADGEAFDIF
jgi:penicillin-binding protein 1A